MEIIAATTAPRPSAPYVGMRPYERHERDLLIGRAADARFLTDKVFSERLTLFYAPSGLGKSSVLRASVIPELEHEECVTLYLDAWAGEEPETDVRQALRGLAGSLGLGNAFSDSAPLASLVRVITACGRTLVLVLDQFEEFLLNHAQRLDPLRKELATLVNAPDLDLRVLIALREEFLANLEPFRGKIVNLFQSTYRLEPLDRDDVRKAIRKPARLFGVEYEDALLDCLVADLEAREDRLPEGKAAPTTDVETRLEASAGGKAAPPADLPMLQVVCTELWDAAKAKQLQTLTFNFYQKLGGVKRIMDSYVRKAMPPGWRWFDRVFSAKLMTYLAPPSGLKISYAVSDLAGMSGLDTTRIETELRRLASKEVRILRVRQFKAGERFELQHDALIPRIGPWRDRVLKHNARAKLGLKLFGFVLAVCVLFGIVHVRDTYQLYDQLYVNGEQRLEIACRDPNEHEKSGPIFDQVASYLLVHERREVTWDKLVGLLQKYEYCLPASYGFDTSGYEVNRPVPIEDDWPLALHLSEERQFDEAAFLQSWQSIAAEFTARSGAPLPRQLTVIKNATFPHDLVRLESDRRKIVEAEVAEPDGAALVSIGDDSPILAKGFHERFRKEWTQWKESAQQESPGAWWGVPRWSLPVWKAAGAKTSHRSADVALALKWQLDKHPGHLLTDGAARYLLARSGAALEVLAPFCAKPGDVLTMLIRYRTSLQRLPFAVDALSSIHPERWPEAIRTFAQRGYVATLKLTEGETISRLGVDRATECDPLVGTPNDAKHLAYREMEPWLPPIAAPIRMLVGEDLVRSWAPDSKNLAPWVQEAIGETRDLFYKRMGTPMPPIRFRGSGSAEPAGPLEARLGLLGGEEVSLPAHPLGRSDAVGLQELLDALVPPVGAVSAAFVLPDWVAWLMDELRPHLKAWLKERYSVMDVQRVLRAVLLPVGSDASGQLADDQTLRHPEWLLGALVFWEAANGPPKVADIAAFLRELQGARLAAEAGAEPASTAPQGRAGPVAQAVNDLLQDRVQSAQRHLAEAVHAGRAKKVREQFIQLYAAGHRGALLSSVNDRCNDPINPSQGNLHVLRADLSDLLSRQGDGALALPRERVRSLELCRIATYSDYRAEKQASEAAALAAAGDRPDNWPAAEALWLGQKILKHYDPVRDPPRQRDDGTALLGSALRRMPSVDKVANAFHELLNQCADATKANTWCWSVAQSLAKQLTGNPWVAIDMGLRLIERVQTNGLETALEWAAEGERRLNASNLKKSDREHGLRWARLIRAKARLEVAQPGDVETLAHLEHEFRQMLNSTVDEAARSGLAELMLYKRQAWGDAERIGREAMDEYPDSPEFISHVFLAALMQGDRDGALELVQRAERKAEKLPADRDEFLFLAALGHLLTGEGRWELAGRQFLQTPHRYVNIIAIFLDNRMSGTAAQQGEHIIKARWSRFDRTSWQTRMTQGDESAWLEMLLGFYLGEVPSKEILEALETDAAYAASDFAKLPIPRQSLLTDAYFYQALRRQKGKDIEGRSRSLQKVVDICYTSSYEYFMARYLLSQGR